MFLKVPSLQTINDIIEAANAKHFKIGKPNKHSNPKGNNTTALKLNLKILLVMLNRRRVFGGFR
jgi:hypothetical protein